MKTIPSHVYVSPLIFLLIFFSWVIGKTQELFILFLIIIIHEIAHILAAKYYKLKVNKICITPIGINAKINFTSKQKANQIIIHAAGPLSNLVMAVLGYIINSYFWDNSQIMSFFILANICILFLNILPVLPLDGGRIFKSILLEKLGYKCTLRVFFILTRIISIFLIILGIYQFLYGLYNLSLLFIGIFLYLYVYKEKDELQYLLIKELIYKKQNLIENKVYHVEYIICFETKKVIDVIKDFYSNKYHIVKILNKNMLQVGEITETQMLESLANCNFNVTLGEALEYCLSKEVTRDF